MLEEVLAFYFLYNLDEDGDADLYPGHLSLGDWSGSQELCEAEPVVGFRRKRQTVVFSICSGNKEEVKKIRCQL